jgi:hypothetical protein
VPVAGGGGAIELQQAIRVYQQRCQVAASRLADTSSKSLERHLGKTPVQLALLESR